MPSICHWQYVLLPPKTNQWPDKYVYREPIKVNKRVKTEASNRLTKRLGPSVSVPSTAHP
eukprot:scaffold28074_cov34-Prasinocladus_malaysianus.AAC.1